MASDWWRNREIEQLRGGQVVQAAGCNVQRQFVDQGRQHRALDFDGRTMAWSKDFEAKVAALTPEQIGAAMARHLDPAAWVIVKAGDFKTAEVK